MSYRPATTISLLLTLLLSTLVIASPALPRNLTTPPTLSLIDSNPSLNPVSNPQATQVPPQMKCSKVGFLKADRRPLWSNCYRAIRALPNTHDSGTFHTSGFNDVWRLPRSETFVNCRAQVELADRARAPFSWIAVKTALDDLSVQCRAMSRSKHERTGGWMLAGPEGKIKVSLLGPNDPDIPHFTQFTIAGNGSVTNETFTE